MPERWSPRALVHTVPQAMPNYVWGFVLPGEVATAVVDWLKVTWLNGKTTFEVYCSKLDRALLIHRDLIKVNGVVW